MFCQRLRLDPISSNICMACASDWASCFRVEILVGFAVFDMLDFATSDALFLHGPVGLRKRFDHFAPARDKTREGAVDCCQNAFLLIVGQESFGVGEACASLSFGKNVHLLNGYGDQYSTFCRTQLLSSSGIAKEPAARQLTMRLARFSRQRSNPL